MSEDPAELLERGCDDSSSPKALISGRRRSHDLDRDEFRAKNPFGQLPVIDDDGVVVTESGAILGGHARCPGDVHPRDT